MRLKDVLSEAIVYKYLHTRTENIWTSFDRNELVKYEERTRREDP